MLSLGNCAMQHVFAYTNDYSIRYDRRV